MGNTDLSGLDGAALAALENQLLGNVLTASFADFVRAFWPVVEPTRALLPSVAIDGICAVLQEAAERGGRWAISCPPGVSKSLLTSVLFPAWLLLRTDGRERVMVGSYSWDLSVRDSVRCRALIESPAYRRLAGWNVSADVDRRDDWWTSAGGRRLVTSVAGKATGERVNVQIIDDAIGATDVHSPAKRKDVLRWINEVLPSRLDDPDRALRLIVGQRLHPQDPISVAAEQGWQHLVLPALATDEPCELRRDDGTLIWRDPRKPGEPLFDLLGPESLARLKLELGSASFAAQYQQRPHDDSSAMFRRAWLERRWTEAPTAFEQTLIAVDATFKESKSADFCVLQVWGARGADRYLLEQVRRQMGFHDTLRELRAMIARHRFAKIVIEEGANGFAIVDELKREIPGVIPTKPEGGKVARAQSVTAIVESGAVLLPAAAPWVDDFVDEVCAFPGGKNDDQLDAMVYALRALQTPLDPDFEEKRTACVKMLLRGKPEDLYAREGKAGVIRRLDKQLAERYAHFAPARDDDFRPGEPLDDKPAGAKGAKKGPADWECSPRLIAHKRPRF